MKVNKVLETLRATNADSTDLRRCARDLAHELPNCRIESLREFRAGVARLGVARDAFVNGYRTALVDVTAAYEDAVRDLVEGEDRMMQPHVEGMLRILWAFLRESGVELSEHCGNGGEFQNSTFRIGSYCWCDGSNPKHEEEGCPSCFSCGEFTIDWYKHMGRGDEQSDLLHPSQVVAMLNKCIASLIGGKNEPARV